MLILCRSSAQNQNNSEGHSPSLSQKVKTMMNNSPIEMIPTTPVGAPVTIRTDSIRAITSGKPGKIIPLIYAPMLREERLVNGKLRIQIEMAETVETPMTNINATVHAYFIPFLAFERFGGSLDRFNRSYRGVPDIEGGSTIAFFNTVAYNRAFEIFKSIGIHAKNGTMLNSSLIEAYNVMVNYRRKARSTKLPLRQETETALAACFWKNSVMSGIVPDFDAAAMDAEVPLQFSESRVPVTGIARNPVSTQYDAGFSNKNITGGVTQNAKWTSHGASGLTIVAEDPLNPGFPGVFAEMQNAGITVSLANIELAKKTAAFAQLRKRYSGHDDDFIVDLLMSAIRVPNEELSQPVLLDRQSTVIGYTKRRATDGANLDKAVTTGLSYIDLNMRTPAMNTGGILLVTCEIVPEQMWERMSDPFMHTTTVESLPRYDRDELDPQKVSIVQNSYVDVEHNTPTGIFGYAGLNYDWFRNIPKIGGKFMRQLSDPFVEARPRLWTNETLNPSLTADFYLANAVQTSIFADTLSDPFEITTIGGLQIAGHTVFGKGLQENTDDYNKVKAIVDDTRVNPPAPV
jgi:hypothetical protein